MSSYASVRPSRLLALRCLDLGAAGLIFPHVDSHEDAARAVAASHYPPWGERGFATYSRAGRFGTVTAADHVAASRETLVVAMVETRRACEDAEAILGTEGVDAVLVGPADLAVDCGFPGAGVVEGLTARAHDAARAHKRAVMTIVPSLDSRPDRRAPGGAARPLQHGPCPHGHHARPGRARHDVRGRRPCLTGSGTAEDPACGWAARLCAHRPAGLPAAAFRGLRPTPGTLLTPRTRVLSVLDQFI